MTDDQGSSVDRKDSSKSLPDSARPTDAATSRPEAAENRLNAVEERMSAFERSMGRLTSIQVIVAIAAGVVAIATGAVIAGQWYEMHSGSVDTHELAVAAQKQSEATKSIAEASKAQSENTAKLADFTSQEVRQLAANVREAHAATAQAESSLQKSERPWVNAEGIEVLGFDPPTKDGETLKMTMRVTIRNTGKSIATNGAFWALPIPNVSGFVVVKAWRRPCEMIERFKAGSVQTKQVFGGDWPHGFVLTPGESVAEQIGIGQSEVTFANFRQGYWVLGCLTYDDQFGTEHHTTFCFQPAGPSDNPRIPALKICNAFQEAN